MKAAAAEPILAGSARRRSRAADGRRRAVLIATIVIPRGPETLRTLECYPPLFAPAAARHNAKLSRYPLVASILPETVDSRGEARDLPQLSVVVPVFDEEENLRPLDSEIRDALRSLRTAAEIIYVDDCSRDRSLEVLKEIAGSKNEPIRTRVVKLRRNFGQTAAMAAGFELAEGAIILPLDADGQNNPSDIPRLVEKLSDGFDVVSGWRRTRRDGAFSRQLPSRVANFLISRISGVRLHDHGCTLKAYRAALLKEIRLYGDMHRFIPVYLGRRGARVTEIEVDHRPRRAGVSKYGSQRILRVLLDLVLIRYVSRFYSRPMQFFGQIALWFVVATLGVGLLMITIKFGWLRLLGIDYQASFVETPLPAVAAAFIIGIINSLFFGVLGEILIRADYESRGAKPYAIEAVFES